MSERKGPMFNPPHPGEILREDILPSYNMSLREFAGRIGVAPSTLSRVLNCESAISPEMALRLEKALATSATMWLNMQQDYDLWQLRRKLHLDDIHKISVTETV